MNLNFNSKKHKIDLMKLFLIDKFFSFIIPILIISWLYIFQTNNTNIINIGLIIIFVSMILSFIISLLVLMNIISTKNKTEKINLDSDI